MTEALHLALRYAFKNLKLHRIEANIQPENEDSRGSRHVLVFDWKVFPRVI